MSASPLNPNQRRHFAVLLSMLETELEKIETVARGVSQGEGTVTLTQFDDDLPSGFHAAARPQIDEIRAHVRALADSLELAPRRVSRRRSIRAALTGAIIRIDDSSPSELRGYGAVDPRFVTEVAPALAEIRSALVAVKDLLAGGPFTE